MSNVYGLSNLRVMEDSLKMRTPEKSIRLTAGSSSTQDLPAGVPSKKHVEGSKVKYSTGSQRSSDAEAYRYDLISPIGLKAVARTCAEGAEKYGEFNWEKGQPVPDILNHAIKHIYEFLSGDRSEDHLGHAAWNLMAAIHTLELNPQLGSGLRKEGCVPPPEGE